MNNIFCRIIELPLKVNAVTAVDENGDFNVYVNSRLSEDEARKALRHELRHVRMHHFYKIEKRVSDCEDEAKNGKGYST